MTNLVSFNVTSSGDASQGQSAWAGHVTATQPVFSQDFTTVSGAEQAPITSTLNSLHGPGQPPCSKVNFTPGTPMAVIQSFTGSLVNSGADIFALSCFHGGGNVPAAGADFWNIDGALVSNGGSPVVIQAARSDSFPTFNINGAALTALENGGTLSTIVGIVTYAYPQVHATGVGTGIDYPTYVGDQSFMEFEDEPPDDIDNASTRLSELRNILNGGQSGYLLGTQSDGTEVTLRDCTFAAPDATGNIFIRPEDIGNQLEQIPSDVLLNTAAHFRFYPGAFLRRTSYVRTLSRVVRDPRELSVGGLGQPLQITSITTAPTASRWLFVVDGVSEIVDIEHPDGSDFRRGDEIWNNVIAPAIHNAQGPTTSIDILNGTLPLAGNVLGLAGKLKYLQYARYIQPQGANTTLITQTNTSPI